jgi:hypothetical protein
MGNYHAQFLGGLGSAMTPGYPVFGNFADTGMISKLLLALFFANILNYENLPLHYEICIKHILLTLII